jgi:hypothetical protein
MSDETTAQVARTMKVVEALVEELHLAGRSRDRG